MLPSPLSIDEIVPHPSNKVGLAVLGRPIAHSISPILHHAALENLSLNEPNFSNWNYERIDVDPGDLSHALAELQRSCLLYTSPSPRDQRGSRMPSSA